jgi:hypothetical protein
MGRVYEEFNYSIPNLILLAVTLPAAHWIEGRWTPFGVGMAAAVATAGSACVLMGRVLFVLHLRLLTYLREVIVPGLAPYLIAAVLAWPVAQLVAMVNRWQGAVVLLAAGILYMAGVLAVLHRWVLTDAEKQKGVGWYRGRLGMLRNREATV